MAIGPEHIAFDAAKRAATFADRGLDFADFWRLFEVEFIEGVDTRHDYGEERRIVFGVIDGRLYFGGYVRRGDKLHVFTFRKANPREQARFNERP